MPPLVYFFGNGRADGTREMKSVLGGKGANLAEMTNLGVPVPPGFTIACSACNDYLSSGGVPDALREEVGQHIAYLEQATGRKLGDPANPLLVSVRSGAAVSMPGMMETVLNLGLNDETIKGLSTQSGNPRFAWDAYRRFLQMYGDVVLNVPASRFEALLTSKRLLARVENDSELTESALHSLASEYKALVRNTTGVGKLIRMAVNDGRTTRPGLKAGICGEHGGEPRSIAFCHQAGLDYVSCSPFRVPIARLAAAQAALGT